MAFFRKDPARFEKLQEKIAEEIRDRVIRREGELREKKEKKLWEQSNIEALQEITDFVSDAEVKRIVKRITEEWEEKGVFEGREAAIEDEIRKEVIERERELGLEKEQLLRERGQLDALRQVTDFVTDREIDRIAREVKREMGPRSKKRERGSRSKRLERAVSWERMKARKVRSFVFLAIPLGILPFWIFTDQLDSYLFWTLPLAFFLALDLFRGKDAWSVFLAFAIFGLLPYFLIFNAVRPLWMDAFAWPDSESANALIRPIMDGENDEVVVLLEGGSRVNVRNSHGITPLMAAAEAGNLLVLQFLVERGGHLNPADEEGNTALMKAAEWEHPRVVKYLVNAGVDVSLENDEGSNALHAALRQENRTIVEILLAAGLQLDGWVEEENPDLRTVDVVFEALACGEDEWLESFWGESARPRSWSLAFFLGSPKTGYPLDAYAIDACRCGMEEVYALTRELGADHEGCDFGVGQGR